MINEQSVRNDDLSSLKLDLSGLELEDIEVFLQEGSRGMPDFAASTGMGCFENGRVCSCTAGR